MKVIITQENKTVGVIDDWTGPLPGKGDYIFHPPLGDRDMPGVMSVKCLTFRMLTRSSAGAVMKHFIAHPEPYVEITV